MSNKKMILGFSALMAVFTLFGCDPGSGVPGNTKVDGTWLAQQFAAITTAGNYTITVTEDSTEPDAIWFNVPGATVTLKGKTGSEKITVAPTIGETFLEIRGGKVILQDIIVKYNASTSHSLFYIDVPGTLEIADGAIITSHDDIFAHGTFIMTGGSFTYTNMDDHDSGLAGRGGTMTITGGTINSTIWGGASATIIIGDGSGTVNITGRIVVSEEDAAVIIGGGSGTTAINDDIYVGGANSSFEKKANSTVTGDVRVSGGDYGMYVSAYAPGSNEVLKAKVNATDDGIIDKTGAWNDPFGDAFQVRITGIPDTIMEDGYEGYNLIGIGPANLLEDDGSNAFAGRNTSVDSYDDIILGGPGDNWVYIFFMYNAFYLTDQIYHGSAGNYDIGVIVTGGINAGTKMVLRNQAFKVGELNTFAYSSFDNF
jgi:hypothetical protein